MYGEYRKIFESKLMIEPYAQIHWAEARVMELKYAGVVNLKCRLSVHHKIGLFAGVVPFYEYGK